MDPSNKDPVPGPSAAAAPTKKRRPFSTFDEYLDRDHGKVVLNMTPEPRVEDIAETPWEATLTVLCADVPRLMREGFFWSDKCIIREEGSMSHTPDETWPAGGFKYMRTWILAEKPPSGDSEIPGWVARLQVFSGSLPTLARLRVRDLTPGLVRSGRAWNSHGEQIYQYNVLEPESNYNCIYDDEPLHGWWPWPMVSFQPNTIF